MLIFLGFFFPDIHNYLMTVIKLFGLVISCLSEIIFIVGNSIALVPIFLGFKLTTFDSSCSFILALMFLICLNRFRILETFSIFLRLLLWMWCLYRFFDKAKLNIWYHLFPSDLWYWIQSKHIAAHSEASISIVNNRFQILLIS
jgi:hypothetical protein